MVNAAIVGLGWWGKNILQAVQGRTEKLRFVHGVSKEIDAALPLAEKHGFRAQRRTSDGVLNDKRVKAVVLATPHSLHADQIVRVAAAGKPVFCEKPLSLEARRCRARGGGMPTSRRADRRRPEQALLAVDGRVAPRGGERHAGHASCTSKAITATRTPATTSRLARPADRNAGRAA